ncbi:putative ABC transport system substrate-binding protein [Pseudoxanthobacter soli DSM 19599]|uniref:Putative ABC transport system substrate-binding protein n=1 Tax=Pseudoxanthobacter soli DSM 19599 TaxID=1123029 RepID=A0A1M7Z7G0_9HYPH|nr:ABC transporter substrate-binding protein [Pseudoxanthobacter soli]SHO60636.1 putative ABC transport system substrate-binding protein [Pseudoxanthobacter soli DSM 19599]
MTGEGDWKIGRRRALALFAAGLSGGGAMLGGGIWPTFAADVGDAGADRKPHRIFMITYRGETEAEQGFRDYFAQRQIPVEIISRDIGRDLSKMPALIDEIRATKPDLIYTWGTPVTLATVGQYDAPGDKKPITDIPVVFSMVAAPVQAKVVPALESSGRNVTGAFHVVPLDAQMRAMQSYRSFDTVGVLYSQGEQNSVALVEQLRGLSATMGFRLVTQTFAVDTAGKPTAEGVPEAIARMKSEGVDWLYLLPDTFLGTIYDILGPAAIAQKLPCFGAAELSIHAGVAVAGLVCRYYSVGQLAASKAEKILLDGIKPADIPVETLKRFSFIVNMPVASRLGLYPPLAMLNYAEVIVS